MATKIHWRNAYRYRNLGDVLLESVHLVGAPCYAPEGITIGPLGKCNFFFGANGAGKTTLSRALGDEGIFPGSTHEWNGDRKIVRTYNRDYVRNTFGTASPELPGVFLLGQDSRDVHTQLDALRVDTEALRIKKRQWEGSLSKNVERIRVAYEELKVTAWGQRDVVPHQLQEMFKGYKGSRENFLQKVLEVSEQHVASVDRFDTLQEEAASVLDLSAARIEPLARLAAPGIKTMDGADLLTVPIVGSADVALTPLIEQLHNGDWVHHGQQYLERAAGRCPFCQQEAPEDLAQQLNAFFDARYASQLARLARLKDTFDGLVDRVGVQLDELEERLLDRADAASVRLTYERLRAVLQENRQRIERKLQRPSDVIELDSIEGEISSINELVNEANSRIAQHNALVENRSRARMELIDRCWQAFVHGTLAVATTKYKEATRPLEYARAGLENRLGEADSTLQTMRQKMEKLHTEISSSEPIIRHINQVLDSVGFHNFSLKPSATVKDGYLLVRENDTPADVGTLSEGERTFITFLYFYHQLRDVRSDASGVPIVAVIDDPISSLDSDVLFVVSSLIKTLMAEVDKGTGTVKQLVLMTHNAHFHNEVTYRKEGATNRYFVVRKSRGGPSEVVSHGSKNPVRTVYKGLWDEVGRAKAAPGTASIGLQNIMRRILENYFRILGGLDDDKVIAYFTGEQQTICRSLLSWANDGSHSSTFDSIDFSPTEVSTTTYLEVFEEIFNRSGNPGHYKMMMPPAEVERLSESMPSS